MNLTKDGTGIKTFQQLLLNLSYDENSFSGSHHTMMGIFDLNGMSVFVYKHWSCPGNFHIYSDSTCSQCIGEIKKVGDAFPYLDESGNQVLEHGWEKVYDWNISIEVV